MPGWRQFFIIFPLMLLKEHFHFFHLLGKLVLVEAIIILFRLIILDVKKLIWYLLDDVLCTIIKIKINKDKITVPLNLLTEELFLYTITLKYLGKSFLRYSNCFLLGSTCFVMSVFSTLWLASCLGHHRGWHIFISNCSRYSSYCCSSKVDYQSLPSCLVVSCPRTWSCPPTFVSHIKKFYSFKRHQK